jgi:mannan endo-1,4-beta-mannosidase
VVAAVTSLTICMGSAGFLTRSGTSLTLAGAPYRLVGINVYTAFWGSRYAYSSDLTTALPILAGKVNSARAFAFQSTAITAGVRDWTDWDAALALFAANGIKVVVCLTDTWGQAHHALSDTVNDRLTAWYAGGYGTDVEGVATYRNWVIEAVTRYRDNPTIAMWQLINEGHCADVSGDETTSRAALKAWADDMAQLVKSIDPNHMVASGLAGGMLGTTNRNFGYTQTGPDLDVMEYHDYGHDGDAQPYPSEPLGFDDGNNGWADYDDAVTNGKIFMILEFGLHWLAVDEAHGGPWTRAQRATYYDAKIAAQLAAGSQGELVYSWHDAPVSDIWARDMEIAPDDPALSVLAAYLP